MPDNRFDGRKVSTYWDVVLTEARRQGVKFRLNSGRRTISEQLYLYRNRGNPGFARVVAFPSPNAPHIRVGRQAHALDINAADGGETRLQRWLESKGAHPTNPVRGEPWHIELSGRDLSRLARRYRR
jgi:hypothetical protein